MTDTLKINDCWNKIGVWSNGDNRCEKLDNVIHCYNCDIYSNAGRSLLNRESPEGYGDDWADILASGKKLKSKNLQSAVVFRLGSEWLSLPVSIINEITLLKNIYDIPHNHNKKIRGMVNIRGELVICMSLGNLLGVEKPDDDFIDDEHSINRLITIREDNGYIVFPVSEIDGIVHYEKEKLATAPDTIRNSTTNLIDGVTIVNDKNIGCIDHVALLAEIAGNLR
ncbi:MAG: chemotaxis protein CheW [Sulfuriflexus sp.]|nr:chemotaxis protein CheW [Sulfuriflexus sp.]